MMKSMELHNDQMTRDIQDRRKEFSEIPLPELVRQYGLTLTNQRRWTQIYYVFLALFIVVWLIVALHIGLGEPSGTVLTSLLLVLWILTLIIVKSIRKKKEFGIMAAHIETEVNSRLKFYESNIKTPAQ